MSQSPFHSGEFWVQEKLGVRHIAEQWGKQIRTFIPKQQQTFYEQLPFVILSARDDNDQPWITVLTDGRIGFIQSPDSTSLRISAQTSKSDILANQLNSEKEVGILGIELATRRRNRANGVIKTNTKGVIDIHVKQAFGNCPQYISPRQCYLATNDTKPAAAVTSSELNETMVTLVSHADTFFIASGNSNAKDESHKQGLDSSHRGGQPGFVEVIDNRTLLFPDYSGNHYFNTIGNLINDPKVGLLFIDFSSGTLLQITGKAKIDWDCEQVALRKGALRLIKIQIEKVNLVQQAIPLFWERF